MFDVRRSMAMAGMLFGIGILLPAQARAFELSGAWATQADLCKLVFAKRGNGVVFAELSDVFGSGFIIEGKLIRGKAAHCTITSKKQDGDSLELGASCATSILNRKVGFSLKVIDDNNLTRLFPEIPGMTLNYTRCAL
jgi:hypothetical protein